jgi:hypothetical protein
MVLLEEAKKTDKRIHMSKVILERGADGGGYA